VPFLPRTDIPTPTCPSVLRYVAVAFTLSTFMAGNFGLTVKSMVTSPGLQPPWVPCFTPAVCNGTINFTVAVTDGYHDTDGYGFFELMPGFWALLAMQVSTHRLNSNSGHAAWAC
jgi:hypothetical protein